MAQAFETTYQKWMKWHELKKRKSKKQLDEWYDQPPSGDIWMERAVTSEQMMRKYSRQQLEAMLLKLYLDRYMSTYNVSYDHKFTNWDSEEEQKASTSNLKTKKVENELIEYGKRVFTDKTQKVIKPMATSRKLFGYLRPKRMYTGLTEYQAVIDQLGYNVLRKNEPGSK